MINNLAAKIHKNTRTSAFQCLALFFTGPVMLDIICRILMLMVTMAFLSTAAQFFHSTNGYIPIEGLNVSKDLGTVLSAPFKAPNFPVVTWCDLQIHVTSKNIPQVQALKCILVMNRMYGFLTFVCFFWTFFVSIAVCLSSLVSCFQYFLTPVFFLRTVLCEENASFYIAVKFAFSLGFNCIYVIRSLYDDFPEETVLFVQYIYFNYFSL